MPRALPEPQLFKSPIYFLINKTDIMIIDFKISKHKFFEFQIDWDKEWWDYFLFLFKINRKTDHAGLSFHLSVCWFGVYLTVYDHRHWDDDNDCWYNYNEDKDINNEENYGENK